MSSTDTPSSPPHVLVVSATVGSGHNQAARAILAGVKSAAPDIRITQLDILPFAPRLFRAYYSGGFALAMTRLPRPYGWGFRLTNRPHRPGRAVSERVRLGAERLVLRKFARYLLNDPPDLIVHTHFLAAPLVGQMIAQGRLRSPQMVVITDNEVHRWWYAENVSHWFAPADFSTDTLRRWGIDERKITVSGIPIHPKWTAPPDRDKILADWRLPADKKIVLLSGGTEFTCGPVVRIAESIVRACPQAYVVVLAGRNKALLAELSRHSAPGRLVGVGFTDRIHELVEVCSLMVTKAGGVTTAECLAAGAPMVLLKPVPGQEGGNALYFQRAGAAVITPNTAQVAAAVGELLGDPVALAKLAVNARRLYRPATQTITDAICRAVESAVP